MRRGSELTHSLVLCELLHRMLGRCQSGRLGSMCMIHWDLGRRRLLLFSFYLLSVFSFFFSFSGGCCWELWGEGGGESR